MSQDNEVLQPGQTSKDGRIKNDGNEPIDLDAGQRIDVPRRHRDRGADE